MCPTLCHNWKFSVGIRLNSIYVLGAQGKLDVVSIPKGCFKEWARGVSQGDRDSKAAGCALRLMVIGGVTITKPQVWNFSLVLLRGGRLRYNDRTELSTAELSSIRAKNNIGTADNGSMSQVSHAVTPPPSGAASPSTLGRERHAATIPPKKRLHHQQTEQTKCPWLHCQDVGPITNIRGAPFPR